MKQRWMVLQYCPNIQSLDIVAISIRCIFASHTLQCKPVHSIILRHRNAPNSFCEKCQPIYSYKMLTVLFNLMEIF